MSAFALAMNSEQRKERAQKRRRGHPLETAAPRVYGDRGAVWRRDNHAALRHGRNAVHRAANGGSLFHRSRNCGNAVGDRRCGGANKNDSAKKNSAIRGLHVHTPSESKRIMVIVSRTAPFGSWYK